MADASLPNPVLHPAARELQALVQRAQTGDAGALPEIRRILDERPEIWQALGDLTALTERAWLSLLTNDNPLAVESMQRTLAALKADLAGEHPTRLERLLVGQVVSTWMELKFIESPAADPGPISLEQAAFQLKRQESAQKRFDQAVKTFKTTSTWLPRGLAPVGAVKLFDEKRTQASGRRVRSSQGRLGPLANRFALDRAAAAG